MASAVALRTLRNRAAYIASQLAVVGLTRAAALELMGAGIRCNCVAPGVVDTPWVTSIVAGQPDPVAARAEMERRQPLGRLADVGEIACRGHVPVFGRRGIHPRQLPHHRRRLLGVSAWRPVEKGDMPGRRSTTCSAGGRYGGSTPRSADGLDSIRCIMYP